MMARVGDTNYQEMTAKSDALFLVACCSTAIVVGFGSIFVASSYFGLGEIPLLISAQGADPPHSWGGVTPLGVHYAGDLLEAWRYAKGGSPWINRGMYPPFAYALLYPLTYMNYWISYVLLVLSGAVATCVLFWRGLTTLPSEIKVVAITIVVLMSQPMIVAVDRGSLLTLVVALALGGYMAFVQKRFTVAGVLFALAAGIKIYPVLFLLLLVRAKQWKALAVSVGVGLIATVLPLMFFGDGIASNLYNWKVNFSSYQSLSPVYRDKNNSLLGLFDALQYSGFLGLTGFWESLANYHTLAMIGLLAITIWLRLLPKVSVLEILLLIASVMYLSLNYAAPYSLIFLLLPVFALLSGHYRDVVPRLYRRTYCVLVAVSLAPKNIPLFSLENVKIGTTVPTVATYVNPLLAVILILIIAYRATRTETEGKTIFARPT